MGKELKDYLPFYIGCEMEYASHHEPQNERYILTFKNIEEAIEFGDLPFLRPLSDITKEEVADLMEVNGFIKEANFCSPFFQISYTDLDNKWQYKHQYWYQLKPSQFQFLLSKHFDLFGLIEAGLAIDKSTLKTNS